MTRRRRYLQNAALLTASSLVLRLLGMGFRVILSAYLGGEGMGLYQLIMALYAVFIALATAGVNVASTRLAAQSLARGQGLGTAARRLCTTALLFGTAAWRRKACWPTAGALAAARCAGGSALRVLAPSLPFMAVAGALRGCFLAARKVAPNVTAPTHRTAGGAWRWRWPGCGCWPGGAWATAARR